MAAQSYDAVIVGGRCAGAALATFLARDGMSVAVIDADPIGSDQVISTHTIHPAGLDVLDEIGVGHAVREHAPPARAVRLDFDGSYVEAVLAPGRHECCPRRYRLDRLLQETAIASGVDFRERTRATALLRDGDRVAGVVATHAGESAELRARITVGADGRHSTIARLVGAEEYLDYDSPRGAYWAYWAPPPAWNGPDYPYDILIKFDGDSRRLVFSTDDGEILIGTLPHRDIAMQWRSDRGTRYVEDLLSDPELAPIARDGKMTSKVLGTVSERYFFRRSAGPGWALVGDAGHHKDPMVGWGISDALIQAKHLAEAIHDGSDAALQRYWRRRDVDCIPRFRLGEERGAPGRINPLFGVVAAKARQDPDLRHRLTLETEYEPNPYTLMPVPKVALWTLSAAVRGRPSLLGSFLAQGRRTSSVQHEVNQRRKLLDAVTA